jgi:hypothetical protein
MGYKQMMHSTKQIMKKVRCMAKKILKLKNEGRHNCHEIDDLAQEAQYLEIETREYEKKDK